MISAWACPFNYSSEDITSAVKMGPAVTEAYLFQRWKLSFHGLYNNISAL